VKHGGTANEGRTTCCSGKGLNFVKIDFLQDQDTGEMGEGNAQSISGLKEGVGHRTRTESKHQQSTSQTRKHQQSTRQTSKHRYVLAPSSPH
jgi:hypothetical protein